MRIEHDSLGAVQVPATVLWGSQTQRSLNCFGISTEKMPLEFIEALAYVKRACIEVNAQEGRLNRHRADMLLTAVDEVIAGQHANAFPLSIWQTGSATQTNMNMNEVIANRSIALLGVFWAWITTYIPTTMLMQVNLLMTSYLPLFMWLPFAA